MALTRTALPRSVAAAAAAGNIPARRLYAALGGQEEAMVYVTFRLDAEPV